MPRLLPRNNAFSSLTWTTIARLMLFGLLAFHGTPSNAEIAENKGFGPVIGIDLGNTYFSVGVMRNDTVEILLNEQGNQRTPSYVAFTDEGFLIGDAAKNQHSANPHRTIFGKRGLLGRTLDRKDVQTYSEAFPFEAINEEGRPVRKIDVNNPLKTLSLTPEEVSAMILGRIKDTAEGYLGESITSAVCAVPAYFNDTQRQAIRDAGTIAGLDILRVINEPSAAAIAHDLDRSGDEHLVIVYDLGGSSLDVSALYVDNGVFEIVATASDARLGGEDFNRRVMDFFIEQYDIKHKVDKNNFDIRKDLQAMDKLNREVEKAKRTLSSQASTRIEIDDFGYSGEGFSEILTRAKFEELNMDLFKKTLELLEQVLKDAEVEKSEVDHIVLSGGSTHIPIIRSLVEGFFDNKNAKDGKINTLSTGIDPEEAVVIGSAIQGGFLSRYDEGVCSVGPLDVNPLSLGIETDGGLMTKIIPRNTVIPCRKSQVLSTSADDQSTFLVQVFQGEFPMTKKNKLLAKFELTSIDPAPRGVPEIEVVFDYDANGILQVSASDKFSGQKESITINIGNQMTEEIERMIMEAQESVEGSVEGSVEADRLGKTGVTVVACLFALFAWLTIRRR